MKDRRSEEYDVAFLLVEGCHRDLVSKTEVNVTEPEAFMFLQVNLVCLKRKLTEVFNVLRPVHAVPD